VIVGYRLALRHPERVQALIVQNGNAYDEGLREFWDPIKKYWNEATSTNREGIRFLVEPAHQFIVLVLSIHLRPSQGVPRLPRLPPITNRRANLDKYDAQSSLRD
jgi:pimeloyl-ACP methyl ester carboxylesterase